MTHDLFALAAALPLPHATGLAQSEPMILVSWWKPLLILAPFFGWAWLVSTVFDKHAQRFFLGREKWNAIHLAFGAAGLLVAFFLPIPAWWAFLVGLGGLLVLLGADIGLFVALTNRDDRVPEHERLRLDFSSFAEARQRRKEAKQQGTVQLDILSNGQRVPAPKADTPEYAARVAAEQVYIKASQMRASQVDVLPAKQAGAYAVSLLVDGVRQPPEPLPAADAVRAIDFWKAAAGLDVNDRRRKQQGELKVGTAAETNTLKLVTSGDQQGQRLTMIFNPQQAVRRRAEDLGLLDPQMVALRELVADPRGIVLLAAAPDGGRTTTFYSVLRLHDAYTSNVQTVEVEVEDAVEGVRQIVFDAQGDAEFATVVRSALRRDPDVLGLAEVPDRETAQMVVQADHERTRTYVSLPMPDALSAIQAWVKLVGDPAKAAEHLRGVVAQRLIRKLSEGSKIAYEPPPDMLKKLGLPPDKVKVLYKKGSHIMVNNKPVLDPASNGIGYVGQIGLFEVIPVDAEIRQLIAAQNWNGLRAEIRKRGYPTIQQVALRRAVEGVTSIEEVTRVTLPPGKGGATGGQGGGQPGGQQGGPAHPQAPSDAQAAGTKA